MQKVLELYSEYKDLAGITSSALIQMAGAQCHPMAIEMLRKRLQRLHCLEQLYSEVYMIRDQQRKNK